MNFDLKTLLGKSDPTILEAGCNDGTDTRVFLELFPDARIYCFEPDERARERFYAPGAMLYPCAVGGHDGITKFYQSSGLPMPLPPAEFAEIKARLPKGWDYSGSIRSPKNHKNHHPWCKFCAPIEVPIITLDTWAKFALVEQVDFIWADVQGAEVDMIRGAKRVLANTRFLYTEYSNHELYEGQITLSQILEALPNWTIEQKWREDVLLRNNAA